nr:formin-like protein 14 [Aegilops tauschii subsp. strangulata]
MSRAWDDGEARRKCRYEECRDPPRPSPDSLRREEDLRRELRGHERDAPRPSAREDRRDARRSPDRCAWRGRSRFPPPATGGRTTRRRSPSPVHRPDRSPSPSRQQRPRSPRPPAPDPAAPARKYVPPTPPPRPLLPLRVPWVGGSPEDAKGHPRRRSGVDRAGLRSTWPGAILLSPAPLRPRVRCPASPVHRASTVVSSAILKSTVSTPPAATSARTPTPPSFARTGRFPTS